MSKPTSAVKRKYNKNAYRRYEFSVGLGSKLEHCLEEYLKEPEHTLSGLVKNLLCEHFDVEEWEIYVPYHYNKDGSKVYPE